MDLIDLFLICLKVSFVTFGGSAPLPLLRDELGRQRSLLTDNDFASALAIGLLTPGPNGLFVLPVGYFVAGVPGALVAALALSVVAFAVLILLRAHERIAHFPAIKAGTRGIQAATIGLVLTLGYSIVVATVRTPLDLAIAGGAFVLLAFTRVDVLLIVAAAAGLGLVSFLHG